MHTLPMHQSALADNTVRGICAITGTSGYVGSQMANHLANDGGAVKAFSRSAKNERHSRFTGLVLADLLRSLAEHAENLL